MRQIPCDDVGAIYRSLWRRILESSGTNLPAKACEPQEHGRPAATEQSDLRPRGNPGLVRRAGPLRNRDVSLPVSMPGRFPPPCFFIETFSVPPDPPDQRAGASSAYRAMGPWPAHLRAPQARPPEGPARRPAGGYPTAPAPRSRRGCSRARESLIQRDRAFAAAPGATASRRDCTLADCHGGGQAE